MAGLNGVIYHDHQHLVSRFSAVVNKACTAGFTGIVESCKVRWALNARQGRSLPAGKRVPKGPLSLMGAAADGAGAGATAGAMLGGMTAGAAAAPTAALAAGA